MGGGNLTIGKTEKDGIIILTPDGEIDAHTAPKFRETIDGIISSGKLKIVFDLSKLAYISSAGIGVLNAILNTLKGKGGNIAIASPNANVMDTLEVMYFTKKVPVLKHLSDALKSF